MVRNTRQSGPMCGTAFLVLAFLMIGAISLSAETVSGVVHCLDPDLTVSVLADDGDYGPFPIVDGQYQVELPDGIRSGKLVFHRYGRNPTEHFADRDRPVSILDGYHTNVTFQIPEGTNHLELDDLQFAVVTFDVLVPVERELQVALFRDGWKIAGTRGMIFPREYQIQYLVSPVASVQLKLLYEDPVGINSSRLESEQINVVTWETEYRGSVPPAGR